MALRASSRTGAIRRIPADEKWSSEEKGGLLAFEARDDSPVATRLRFKAADAETRTQLVKIMFMPVVTATQPIGIYELDFKEWNQKHGAKTKAGKEAKGVTTGYLKALLPKIAKDGRRKLGPGPIKFLHDRAPASIPGHRKPRRQGGLPLRL